MKALMAILHLLIISQILVGCSSNPTVESSQTTYTSQETLEQRAANYWKKNNQSINKRTLNLEGNTHYRSFKSSYSCSKQPIKTNHLKQRSVSVSFFDTDIREILVEVSVASKTPIILDDTIEGLITVNLQNTPLEQALDIILSPGNYSYRFFKQYILVGSSTPDSPTFSKLSSTCTYKPIYTTPLDLATSLTPYYQQFVRVPKDADFLSITAPENIQRKIKSNIDVFDIKPNQVLLEMSIIEVSRKALDILGVSWNRYGRDPNTLKNRQLGLGEWQGIEPQTSKDILDAFTIGALPQRTLAESIQFLRSEGEATLKAIPTIVTLDGNEAEFSTTHIEWLPADMKSSNANRGQEITYGVDMKIIPRISHNGEITLKIVNASVSDLTHNQQGLPHVISHKISSSVNVKHGDYLVLGGLLQTIKRKNNTGLPGLKNIPLAGKAFGQDNDLFEEMEVLIMIRPRILSDHEVKA